MLAKANALRDSTSTKPEKETLFPEPSLGA